jgi:hypothetical protein
MPKTDIEHDARAMHEIRFKKDYKGPAEVSINLPNGGRSAFNRFQKDKKAKDYPMARCPLNKSEVRELGKHGFVCKNIEPKPKPEAEKEKE